MNDEELEELFSISQYATTTTTSNTAATSTAKLHNNDSVNTVQSDGSRKRPASSVVSSLPVTLPIPPDIESKLFDYQKEGISWLYERHRKGRGCLLADEMGLGKTVQIATFLGALYMSKLATSAIIILPPTLLPLWESALQQWGRLGPPVVEVIHSDAKVKRLQRWQRLKHGTTCLFLTTYGVLRQDSNSMGARMVDYVIMDEAHLIKDASTQVFRSAMALSARHRIAITGTPLMNNFEDLWSIFQFIDGSIFGTTRADFRAINGVLLRGNERDALEKERGDAGRQLALIQAAIRPFMLRRDKREVRMLPVGKRDLIVWLCLNETQERQYVAYVDSEGVDVTLRNTDAAEPLVLLTALMRTCDHPWLNLSDEVYREAMRHPLACPEANTNCGDALNSAKIAAALALVVKCIGEQRKTLVFSRSKRLLDLLAVALRCWWIDFARLDGDVPAGDRMSTVQAFNETARVWVCLLTTQVGGVGLTVEAASAVILMDPSWNPSSDAQAIDRVHRIGQIREVVVYRLITCGTVEEKVYRNQIFKVMAAKQSTSVGAQADQEGGAEFYRYFTRLQLRSMFDVGTLNCSETAAQLDALHPNAVSPEERAALTALPFVCDVSDNSCVHVEAVVKTEQESDTTLTTTAARRCGVKRRRPASPSPSVSKESLHEPLSQEEVSEILLQLEAEATGSQPTTERLLTYDDVTILTASSAGRPSAE
ncbi:putative DNA excision/repair protein SNF2 [Trypanosoma rangeli]|uniref:Putative DNA excision/repair protein SNF2 n=1 Tax=Trypanosoma rangeli TaxID=5698 RepID=A0A3R7MS90_TRYRA|nr:putative DNA excision/repair protein SNF2 [Trypanosoma rangeli]RNF10413.1 putative DNA excision/repair protein SNF2 [Trypanosoma rangeli]|eukprot:RNF10413.1 putative DNA excision/repair protein SNF2 [Trypanosoma rangeli]